MHFRDDLDRHPHYNHLHHQLHKSFITISAHHHLYTINCHSMILQKIQLLDQHKHSCSHWISPADGAHRDLAQFRNLVSCLHRQPVKETVKWTFCLIYPSSSCSKPVWIFFFCWKWNVFFINLINFINFINLSIYIPFTYNVNKVFVQMFFFLNMWKNYPFFNPRSEPLSKMGFF